ncbi:MAG: hypothetical protein KC996_12085 [Phycisphaerales bacterium]|nr:hypothetical protein [Phycisphaerales bacterium]
MIVEAHTNPIDKLMDDATRALMRGSYLLSSNMCLNALRMARQKNDFERMSRIVLPLQECQRYLRQESLEAGPVRIVTCAEDLREEITPGCYLFAPMLVGADARQFRAAANDAGIGVFVLTREPRTSKGLWPMVGVGERVVRVRIEPPTNAIPAKGLLGDKVEGTIDPAWFSAASEAIGDRAIIDAQNAGEPGDPPAWIVDDFLDRLDACPEHEKFLQALADACRNAINAPAPTEERRRGLIHDPYGF